MKIVGTYPKKMPAKDESSKKYRESTGLKKMTCDCGNVVAKQNMSRHRNTKIHDSNINNIYTTVLEAYAYQFNI